MHSNKTATFHYIHVTPRALDTSRLLHVVLLIPKETRKQKQYSHMHGQNDNILPLFVPFFVSFCLIFPIPYFYSLTFSSSMLSSHLFHVHE